MGDDVDSHLQVWEFESTATVDDLLVATSRQFLPGVAGAAGWCVYLDIDDPARKRVLGLIYSRDDLKTEDLICRYARGNLTLGSLARHGELAIFAVYLTFDAARPVTLSEVLACSSYTGATPVVLPDTAR